MSSSYALSPADSSTYEDGYKIFLNRSDFRDQILHQFSSLVKDKVAFTQRKKILDIGCGNGEMTQRYARVLKTKAEHCSLCLVEPASQSLLEAFDLLKNDSSEIQCNYSIPKHEKYDFVIASYVFYHLSPETLNELSSVLNPGGVIAIMMGTSDNPFKSHSCLKKISNHGSTDILTPYLNQLSNSKQYAISRYSVDTHLSLQGLRVDNSLTSEGKALLGFSLNQNFSTLSSEAIKAVEEIYDEAFNKNQSKVKSVHEIIWIERLQ